MTDLSTTPGVADALVPALQRLRDEPAAQLNPLRAADLVSISAHRGRARVRRRRRFGDALSRTLTSVTATVVGTCVTLLSLPAGVATAATLVSENQTSTDGYGHYTEQRPRGLAADPEVRARLERGLRDALRADPGGWLVGEPAPRSAPHVVWAARTPAGLAALVVDRAVVPRTQAARQDRAGEQTVAFLVVEARHPAAPGRTSGPPLRIIAADNGRRLPEDGLDDAGGSRDRYLTAGWLDAERQTLLVVDPGFPVAVSTGFEYGADGSVRRVWTRPVFRDGFAVLHGLDTASAGTTTMARLEPGRSPTESSALVVGGALRTARNQEAAPLTCTGDDGAPSATLPSPSCAARAAGLLQERAERADIGPGSQVLDGAVAVATVCPGRSLTAARIGVHGDAPRIVAMTGPDPGPDPAHDCLTPGRTGHSPGLARLVDLGRPQSLGGQGWVVPLPGRLGWLVAHPAGGLSYALGDGRWVEASGPGASVLPAGSTAVRAVDDDGLVTRLSLPVLPLPAFLLSARP